MHGLVKRFGSAAGGVRSIMVTLLLMAAAPSLASPGDSLLGRWCTEDCEAVFDFYRVKDEYRGRLYPRKYPDMRDSLNPVDSLRSQRLEGRTTIQGLVYHAAKQQWENGQVYNPANGKTYDCSCRQKGDDLVFRGFLKISLLGQSQVWTRVEAGDGSD